MYTSQQSKDAVMQHYDNPKADAFMKQATAESTELATLLAKRDGEENLPPPDCKHPQIYWQSLDSTLNMQQDELKRIHLSDESTVSQQNHLKKEVHQLRIERDQLSVELEKKTGQINKLSTHTPSVGAILVTFIIIALGLTESLMMISAIRLYIPNLLAATAICTLFSAGWVILAHKFPVWFNKGTGVKRLIRRTILIASFSMVFISIGMLRSYYIHLSSLPIEHDASVGLMDLAQMNESLIYTALSWLFFLPAVLISHRAIKMDELSSLVQLYRCIRSRRKIQKGMDAVNHSIQTRTSEIDLLTLLDQSKTMRLKRDEKTFEKLKAHLTTLYISTNLKVRPDRKVPECFSDYLNQTANKPNTNKFQS